MSNLDFKTVEKDGVQFYISNDGKTTGMSISGLARCCGVNRGAIQYILGITTGKTANNQRENGTFENTIETLKPYTGEYFVDFVGGDNKVENKANVIKSEVCASLIEYYSFESRAKNETALKCYRAFALNGIQGWIKQITGYSEPVKTEDDKFEILIKMLTPQIEELKGLKTKMLQLEPIIEEYKTVKDGISVSFKGLETLIDGLKDEYYGLDNSTTSYSLTEWLATKHIELDHGGIRKFGRTVAETFKSCTKELPKKANRKKANGKWSCNVTVYSDSHLPLLDMALDKFIQS